MGIVVTMGAIDGPVEEIGEKVGAALVGTFLGILLSYGFVGPLSVRLEFLGAAELAFFRSIATVIQGFAMGVGPKIAIEMARRGMSSDIRIARDELDRAVRRSRRIVREAQSWRANTAAVHGKWPTRISSPR